MKGWKTTLLSLLYWGVLSNSSIKMLHSHAKDDLGWETMQTSLLSGNSTWRVCWREQMPVAPALKDKVRWDGAGNASFIGDGLCANPGHPSLKIWLGKHKLLSSKRRNGLHLIDCLPKHFVHVRFPLLAKEETALHTAQSLPIPTPPLYTTMEDVHL